MRSAILVALVLASLQAEAAERYWGSGKNFGKGWSVEDKGNVRGMGKEFGKGYQASPNGTLNGTGKSFGERWTPSKQGQKGPSIPPR